MNYCGGLVPAFVAMNMLIHSDDLCKVMGGVPGLGQQCGSNAFIDALDRLALCELFCCCEKAKEPKNQQCVASVLMMADGFTNFNGRYKAEVPFLNGKPVMSTRQPARATKRRPAGSRIPDVVVVKDPTLPPTQDNIQKVYEMKFPGDSWSNETGPDGMTQQEAYQRLFGEKFEKEELTKKNCNCPDDDGEKKTKEEAKASVLGLASRWRWEQEKAIMVPVNELTAGVVGAAAARTPLGREAKAATAVIRWALGF